MGGVLDSESGNGDVIAALLHPALSPWAYALHFPALRLSICEMKDMALPACCVNQNKNERINMKGVHGRKGVVHGRKGVVQVQGDIVLIKMPYFRNRTF